MNNRVYDMAMDLLQEEPYAMQESYSNEQIAECVQHIVSTLNRYGEISTTGLGQIYIKVKNADSKNGGSYLSMSDDKVTSVARSLSEIINVSAVCTTEEVKGLIEMLDEAFFSLHDV